MKALVTGGSGFFGKALVTRLLGSCERVGIFDLNAPEEVPENLQFHRGDICDPQAVNNAVTGYTHIFHNVAQVPLAKNADLFQLVNVKGTEILMEASLKHGVQKVIYTSSSAVFGVPKENPVHENTPPDPGESYGAAKLQGEEICRSFVGRGLDVTVIRPRTILGHGRLGIFDILFKWVSEGKDIPVLGAGDNLYQFVHASDLAEACILAAKEIGSNCYNIGASEFCSMRATLEALCEHAATGSRVVSLPMTPVILLMNLFSRLGLSPLGSYHSMMYGRSMYFDISKASSRLGFKPAYSNQSMIIESYSDYVTSKGKSAPSRGRRSVHCSGVKQGILACVPLVLRFLPTRRGLAS